MLVLCPVGASPWLAGCWAETRRWDLAVERLFFHTPPWPVLESAGVNCVKLSKVGLLSSTWHGLLWNVIPLVFSKRFLSAGLQTQPSCSPVHTAPEQTEQHLPSCLLNPSLSQIPSPHRKFPSPLSDLAPRSCHQIRAGSLLHSRGFCLRHLSLKLHQTLGRAQNV